MDSHSATSKIFRGGFAGNAGNFAGDETAKEMMIQHLEELKKRLADNPCDGSNARFANPVSQGESGSGKK